MHIQGNSGRSTLITNQLNQRMLFLCEVLGDASNLLKMMYTENYIRELTMREV